jgi:MerR family transcriptional regulator, light-induced transcriptional regulator
MRPKTMHKTVISTIDVARLFNVTETTVKRWADDGMLRCQKTPGGHRKFQIRNVVEFAEKNNFEPIGVLAMPGQEGQATDVQTAVLKRDYPALVGAFVDKALSPDNADLYVFFSFLYEHRIALWEIYDLVLRPGMIEIGDRWSRGVIGVSQEHRASYETLDALAKLQNEILVKPATGDAVVFACLGEELHEIGLRCAANVFESEGWQTHYLGARTPSDAVIAAAHELRPTVIALSVTQSHDADQLLADLRRIAEEVTPLSIRMIVGGTGVPAAMYPEQWHSGVLNSARELTGFIETCTADRRARRTQVDG